MATTRERIVFLSVILTLASLFATAFLVVDEAAAEPKKAYGSIGSRVTSQTDICETLGGGELHVSYSYENGKMVGASTSCKGGKHDGYNCTNTATTTDCWQAPASRTVQPPVLVQDRPIATVVAEIDDGSGSQARPGDGSVLEDFDSMPTHPSSIDVSPMPVLIPLD